MTTHGVICGLALVLLAGIAGAEDEIDIEAGRTLWKFCAFCHSADGLGQERSDAPKLAGDPACYTERQLRMFRKKIRGSHPEDQPGLQMFVYTYPLVDDAAIRDMAAFIASLPAEPQNPAPSRMRDRPKNRPYAWDSQFAVVTAEHDADTSAGK